MITLSTQDTNRIQVFKNQVSAELGAACTVRLVGKVSGVEVQASAPVQHLTTCYILTLPAEADLETVGMNATLEVWHEGVVVYESEAFIVTYSLN